MAESVEEIVTTEELGEKRAKELGLQSVYSDERCNNLIYAADDIHELLGEGIELNATSSKKASWTEERHPGDVRIGLLIGTRPIVQESAERQLLDKIVEAFDRRLYQSESGERVKLSGKPKSCWRSRETERM
jgi:hypothetical protein